MHVGLRGFLAAGVVSSVAASVSAVALVGGSAPGDMAVRVALWAVLVVAGAVLVAAGVAFRRAVRAKKVQRRGLQARVALLRDLEEYRRDGSQGPVRNT